MEVYYALAECKKQGDPNLYLHMKGLKELPAEIFELTHLQFLQLSNNKLSDLPEQLALLTDLTGFNVKQNKLSSAPSSAFLKIWPQLRTLDLAGNRICIVDNDFWKNLPAKLQVLSFANNKISELPEDLAKESNTALQNISLRGNQLTVLPPSITSFQGLNVLDISYNNIKSLPQDLGSLAHLTDLQASQNNLESFPFTTNTASSESNPFASLHRLDLDHNFLASLSPDVGLVSSLTYLSLSRNHLKELPKEVWYLPHLEVLKVAKNQIEALCIPSANDHDKRPVAPSLVHLSLASNNLTTLPPEISRLQSLSKLYVAKNNLSMLPEEIGHLSSLQELFLSENNLTELPASLAELPSLLVLDISRNNLNKISKEIKQIRNKFGGHLSVSLPDKVQRGLYIGCVHSANNFEYLRRKKIMRIIRVMSDGEHTKPAIPDDFNFLWIQAHDHDCQNLMDHHFDRCYAFIDEAQTRGERILVHCAAGVSRSATVVIAYLMKKEKIPLDEALVRVRKKRPQVLPNHGFMRQLATLEQELVKEQKLAMDEQETDKEPL